MRFLIDAQLPRRLADWLDQSGFDSIHTLDLPRGNRTPDGELISISIEEKRILVTKDSAFVDSFLLQNEPQELLLVSTGNISNADLEVIFRQNIEKLEEAFNTGSRFLELSSAAIIVHD
jgi:predicted nuclease of predicted toxin-antitoxin system